MAASRWVTKPKVAQCYATDPARSTNFELHIYLQALALNAKGEPKKLDILLVSHHSLSMVGPEWWSNNIRMSFIPSVVKILFGF